MSAHKRYAKAESAAWTGLIGNLCLAAVKGGIGLNTGSKTLLADACRSTSEAASSLVSLTDIRRCRQGGATDAPISAMRGRAEAYTGVVSSILLIIVGLEIGISAIKLIAEGVEEAPGWSAAAVVLIAFVLKELFFPVKERRADLYASLAAIIGTGAAALGKPLQLPILYYFDPAASLIIVAIVFNNGYRIVTASVQRKLFCEIEATDIAEMKAAVSRMEGVVTVEELRAREQGHYVVVEVIVSVNPRISVLEGNEVAKRVKYFLMKRFSHITDVTVHVEPYDPGYPYKSNHDPNGEHITTLLQ